jgi:hypothetical protein
MATKETWEPCVFVLGGCIYFFVDEGHPLLGNHGAFGSRDSCVQFGHTQLNYSELMGGVSAAAISTCSYHPQSERSFWQCDECLGYTNGVGCGHIYD